MIKIVTYNIQFGQGRDGKVDISRIVDVLRRGIASRDFPR